MSFTKKAPSKRRPGLPWMLFVSGVPGRGPGAQRAQAPVLETETPALAAAQLLE